MACAGARTVRQLADVVQPACEPDQLDLLVAEAELHADVRGEVADPGRVAALERVARVDRARERRRRLQPRRPVGRARQPPQLRHGRHVDAIDADTVLALALRPVERDVRDAHESAPVVGVVRERGEAGRESERLVLLPRLLGHRPDDLAEIGRAHV